MSYKLTCPECDTHTSAVFRAYADGRPCPHCGEKLYRADAAAYYRQLPDDHRMPEGIDKVRAKNAHFDERRRQEEAEAQARAEVADLLE